MALPNVTGTSRSPAPVLVLLRGFEPRALMPRSMVERTATSRTAPWMTTPAQPLSAAILAIMSPINALCSDPPPSTTRTWPSPGVETMDLSRALSSKHRTVTAGPEKAA